MEEGGVGGGGCSEQPVIVFIVSHQMLKLKNSFKKVKNQVENIFGALVVTSTQNHWIIHLFDIIETLNKFTIFQDHWIRKFSNNIDLRKVDFHCLHSWKRGSGHLFFPDLKSLLFIATCEASLRLYLETRLIGSRVGFKLGTFWSRGARSAIWATALCLHSMLFIQKIKNL